MRVNRGIVPGFFTMANMFCGFLATLQAAAGEFRQATALIIAAAILDALDGKLARLADASTEFGVQYDSMADVVSFGFAPSALAYFFYFNTWGTVGVFISFMPLVFGTVRLAKFNTQLVGFDKPYFKGIPIPASAMAIATFVLLNVRYPDMFNTLVETRIILVIILFVSIMMITNVRYEKMPNFSLKSNRAQRIKILTVIICVAIVTLFPNEAFFPITIVYLFSGLARLLWRILNSTDDTENVEDKTQTDEVK
ncbi:MAG: CDP-diacylglycerol--serine O-phosphatidyltransferase [Calditrichota bacterium]